MIPHPPFSESAKSIHESRHTEHCRGRRLSQMKNRLHLDTQRVDMLSSPALSLSFLVPIRLNKRFFLYILSRFYHFFILMSLNVLNISNFMLILKILVQNVPRKVMVEKNTFFGLVLGAFCHTQN